MLTVNRLEQIIDDAKNNPIYFENRGHGVLHNAQKMAILKTGVKLKLIKLETIKYAHQSDITKVSLTEGYKKLLDIKDGVD